MRGEKDRVRWTDSDKEPKDTSLFRVGYYKLGRVLEKVNRVSSVAQNLLNVWHKAQDGPYYMKVFAAISSFSSLYGLFNFEVTASTLLNVERFRFQCSLSSLTGIYELISWDEASRVFSSNDWRVEYYEIGDGKVFAFYFSNLSERYPSSLYLHEDLSFEEFCDYFSERYWSDLDTNIIYSTTKLSNHSDFKRSEILPLSDAVGDYIGDCDENEILKYWERYRRSGENRTILLHGITGTGKSTIALRCAKALDGRVLKLDSDVIKDGSICDARFWVNLFRVDVLLIDDIDRFEREDKLLLFLEELNREKNDFLVILTANKVFGMDEAILRPGRIDMIFKYLLPEENQRRDIIEHYMSAWPLRDEIVVKDLVVMTEGLSCAHLFSLVKDASIMSYTSDELRDRVGRMKEYFGDEHVL